jgi:Nucleotidyltransferase of unknown function (DUF6036)
MILLRQQLDEILGALDQQLAALGGSVELVVIGGAALLVLGFVARPTRDVDVLALVEDGLPRAADRFPPELAEASRRVALDFGLSDDWLNAGPADLLRWGLPAGFWERAVRRTYGRALSVRFASRLDQIHFKLYAMVDQPGGRHETDLRMLRPLPEELLAAARWACTHDPSGPFRGLMIQALSALGVDGERLGD